MGLLLPGSHRTGAIIEDRALITAMLRVETAWMHTLTTIGAATPTQCRTVEQAAQRRRPDVTELIAATESTGNPVVALVACLRSAVDDHDTAALIHRGLTSQDVLDTALMLMARDTLEFVSGELTAVGRSLVELVHRHRSTMMPGRTLTQYAVPVTFGLKAAQWLSGVLDAREVVIDALDRLPVQCGGAAGTLALVNELTTEPLRAVAEFARVLGLADPGMPWHTTRTPITRLGHALTTASDALGVIAGDILVLGRPEIAEVREHHLDGRGGSSTMPHKRNPILSVLIRSAALQAPQLGAQLHLAAAQAVDERPDGAWHSEWPALFSLMALTATAAAQSAELVAGLEIDVPAMTRHVAEAADELLAELGASRNNPATYLGAAETLADRALQRFEAAVGSGGKH